MASLKVTVPDPMKEWVRARDRDGSSQSASGFIQMLIRRKQEEAELIDAIRKSDEAPTARIEPDVG